MRSGVRPKPRGWALFRTRVLSLGLVLSIGFMLLVSQVVNAGLDAFSTALSARFGLAVTMLARVGSTVVSVGGVALLFAIVFKLLPAIRPSWRVAWQGALVTTVLFLLGRAAIGLYLGNTATASSFGAAGSLAVLLLWVHYSALIFFFGAEYTRIASGVAAPGETPAAGRATNPGSHRNPELDPRAALSKQ